MLATIIGKLGLPLLITLIAGALAKIDNPVAREASKSLENFEAALSGGTISAEQMAEANRHAEAIAAMKSKEYETAVTEINQSLRAEAASEDIYVRRMRPTFGYLMALSWAAQMLGLAYVVIFETEKAPAIFDNMESLSTIWAVGLSVLGIYVYKRSEEKKILSAAGSAISDALSSQKPEGSMNEATKNVSSAVKSKQGYNE